tara:strand:- start:17 stop:241 length:225 start_codon:yes stop_codon:yes gene_type:complete
MARKFPNHLPMFLVVLTLIGALASTFAIYVGLEDYVCPLDKHGESYGFVKNTEARLTSAIAIIQVGFPSVSVSV